MVIIEKADELDIESLRLCSISAFIDDDRYKPENSKPGGPPGHDAIQSHFNWLRNYNYFKCVVHDKVAGGCIIKKHSSYYELFGIFLCSNFMGKGIGSTLLIGAIDLYPSGSIWILETPDYSIRNHRFYERNGFTKMNMSKYDPSLGYGFIKYIRIGQQATALDAGHEGAKP